MTQVASGLRGVASDCRRVVLHADDLGFSSAIDDGICESFSQGLLTSTSVLANGPSATSGLARVNQISESLAAAGIQSDGWRSKLDTPFRPFDLGVHLNLTQGRPLTAERFPSALLDGDGCFVGPRRLFLLLLQSGQRWSASIRAELAAQISWVYDHGVQPSHVNGHHYLELYPAILEILGELLDRYSIRVVRCAYERETRGIAELARNPRSWVEAALQRRSARHFARRAEAMDFSWPAGYFGSGRAGRIRLLDLSQRLSASGTEPMIEIGLHPGDTGPSPKEVTEAWFDALAELRPLERDMLCSDALGELLEARKLRLGRLADLARAAE
ncbi:MAG: ChbG/HpnK family deacetylase [Planctomycetales bacterium]|nr:ChbG/HpnK family deacetylase [Planctomycetales bacterium]